MKTFYVYQISNDGVPIYIGKGTKTTSKTGSHKLSRTLEAHLTECERRYELGKGNLKTRVFRKHKDLLTFDVLFEFQTEVEAFKKEQELIALHGRRDKGLGPLVNLTDGGEGGIGFVPPPELRFKWRRISQKNGMFGRNHTEESKLKEAETRKRRITSGEIVPIAGYKRPKLSQLNRERGQPVVQFSSDGKYVKTFECAADAARSIDGGKGNIIAAIERPYRLYKGFYWRRPSETKDLDVESLIGEAKAIKASNNSKTITQKTFDGVFVREWSSTSEIIRETGWSRWALTKALEEEKVFNNFVWCPGADSNRRPFP